MMLNFIGSISASFDTAIATVALQGLIHHDAAHFCTLSAGCWFLFGLPQGAIRFGGFFVGSRAPASACAGTPKSALYPPVFIYIIPAFGREGDPTQAVIIASSSIFGRSVPEIAMLM